MWQDDWRFTGEYRIGILLFCIGSAMSLSHRFGPRWPRFAKLTRTCLQMIFRPWFRLSDVHTVDSTLAEQKLEEFRTRLQAGETLYLVGVGPAGHNSGVSLISVSEADGIRLLSNDEEERFAAIKHCERFPKLAFEQLQRRLSETGLTPDDVFGFFATWAYPLITPFALSCVAGEFPFSWQLLNPKASPTWNFFRNVIHGRWSPRKIKKQLGFAKRPSLIGMPHHENHASFAYAASPFAADGEKVAVTVLDGFGDEGAMSLFVAENGQLTKLRANYSLCDSLGAFYSIISSTQGGWTTLSSEGRYMGAVAWGDDDRMTNRYYRRLREILHFGPEGEILVNRSLARWHLSGELKPYHAALIAMIGEPITRDQMWNPDAVLKVDDVEHSEVTQNRVDLAAATQLVFEDAVFHIVEHMIRSTGCSRLVMSGGTALNCLVNMNLVEYFNQDWFRRHMNSDERLQLWVPPTPGDAGVTIGAAYSFALRGGAKPGPALKHAYYCGVPATEEEISDALRDAPDMGCVELSIDGRPRSTEQLADLMAFIIEKGGVLGIYQGPAETGPRALGNRSILANACRSDTLELINSRVKFREPIRPLAPMVTREAAEELFELSEGAAADDYNAYNYMVLTVKARPHAKDVVPAVVHADGTARIQIVREETNPVCHAVLKALGRRVGAEVMVNTSFNVGGPIVQTPVQALETVRRAKALTGLVMISSDGTSRITYHNVTEAPKDGGRQLREWVEEYTQAASGNPVA